MDSDIGLRLSTMFALALSPIAAIAAGLLGYGWFVATASAILVLLNIFVPIVLYATWRSGKISRAFFVGVFLLMPVVSAMGMFLAGAIRNAR